MINRFYIVCIAIIALSIVISCVNKSPSQETDSMEIALQWYPSYPSDNHESVEEGLIWILSYVGESVNYKTGFSHMEWTSDDVLTLDLGGIVKDAERRKLWDEILADIKSKYMEKSGTVDLGRFVFEIFNDTDTYYRLTEMPRHLDEFVNQYKLKKQYDFAVAKGESCISSGLRIFETQKANHLLKTAYLAQEGEGNRVENFEPKEFEVFDFMKNGQPRFAVYNLDGHLITGGDPSITDAGKPAKCMWCHTSQVMPLIAASTDVDGFESIDSFTNLIHYQNKLRRRYLRKKGNDFVLDSIRDHSLGELLYFTYEHPTPQRLRAEGMKEKSINKIEFSQNVEYKFMNLVFDSIVHRSVLEPSFDQSGRDTYLNLSEYE